MFLKMVMTIRLKQTAAVFFCLMLAALLSCPTAGANDGEDYPIRVENPDGLRLFFVRSEITDGDLIVFGRVRRSPLPGRAASTINVSITGLSGKIITERSVKYTPRMLTRHKVRNDGRFYTRFDNFPKQRAVIHVGGEKTTEKD